MKIAYSRINEVIPIKEGQINSLVIENPNLLFSLIADIRNQLNKLDGEVIISQNDSPMDIAKDVCLISDLFAVDLNSKGIVTKLTDNLSEIAVDADHYEETMKIVSMLNNYLADLSWNLDFEVDCEEIIPKQLLKMFNIKLPDDGMEVHERLLRFVELSAQLLKKKFFVFLNLRSFLSQNQFALFAETLMQHDYVVLYIENKEYQMISGENRLVIDIDLCEF